MTSRNSHPVLLKENFGPCRSVSFRHLSLSKIFFPSRSKSSGTAHRTTIRPVAVVERVHVATIEVQVARVVGIRTRCSVRRSTPRVPVGADVRQRARRGIAQARSGTLLPAIGKPRNETVAKQNLLQLEPSAENSFSSSVNPRAQRTGKPFDRFVLLSGFTLPLLKFKLPALSESSAFGEALQESPSLPTFVNAPDVAWRYPEAGRCFPLSEDRETKRSPSKNLLQLEPSAENSFSSRRKSSGTAHRKAVRPVVVIERVHVATVEVQVARAVGVRTRCRVRRSTPRVPVGADVLQRARRVIATPRSGTLLPATGRPRNRAAAKQNPRARTVCRKLVSKQA